MFFKCLCKLFSPRKHENIRFCHSFCQKYNTEVDQTPDYDCQKRHKTARNQAKDQIMGGAGGDSTADRCKKRLPKYAPRRDADAGYTHQRPKAGQDHEQVTGKRPDRCSLNIELRHRNQQIVQSELEQTADQQQTDWKSGASHRL